MSSYHSSLHPEIDDSYLVTGYTNIIEDITDRKALEELSVTDSLTSLHNRRYFDEIFKKEVSLSRRSGNLLTLAIVDVDYFKLYNDCYGHSAGDLVLKKVAKVFRAALKRPNDYAFRIGGEEFAFIFSCLDSDSAWKFLEEVRKQIIALKIQHNGSDVLEYVTVSTGAHIFDSAQDIDKGQFFKKADKSLYVAKQQRNCVVVS